MTATDRHYMKMCSSPSYRLSRRPIEWTQGMFILWLMTGCPTSVRRKRP